MECQRAAPGSNLRQSLSNFGQPRWTIEETVSQSSQVQPSAADDEGDAAAIRDVIEKRDRMRDVLRRGEFLIRRDQANEMVRDPTPAVRKNLGGTDIEAAVDLERVTVDDFAVERSCRGNGKLALARAGRPDNGHQRDELDRQSLVGQRSSGHTGDPAAREEGQKEDSEERGTDQLRAGKRGTRSHARRHRPASRGTVE